MEGAGAAELSTGQVRDWLAARSDVMCEAMRATLTRYSREVRTAGEDGGAHEVARNGAWALIGDAASGHGGVSESLTKLRKVFLAGVAERRDPGAARSEWARIVVRGVQKAVAEGEAELEDICALLGSNSTGSAHDRGSPDSSGSAGKSRSRGSGAFTFTRDDVGNAQRLMQHVGTDARWVSGMGAWAVYDPTTSLWNLDLEHSAIRREMMAVVRGMEAEAQYIEDPKAQAAFMAWVRASGNVGKIKAACELAAGMKGVAVDAALFDADPDILVCSNGTLELGRDGATFRGTRHGDYATFSTGTDYKEGATSGLWEEFLARVIPDPLDLTWIQTLAGYSLLGSNPERVLVIAKGPTSSGKTTFLECVIRTLGRYAGQYNLSMLREKPDETPRADIVEALPRRFIAASEASADWLLHADAIKRFTGGDHISARRLNSNIYISRVPAFTPWLGTNSYPQVPGADKALWRRLKTAPFLIGLPAEEENTGLSALLGTPEARTGILSWLVEGWNTYCVDGLREPSPNALEMLIEAREEMSDLDACLAATCEFGGEYLEPVGRLFDAYKIWMGSNGDERRMLSLQAWGRAMSSKGFERIRARPEGYESDNKIWFRRGLRLRPEWAKLGS
jgi:P4 family phage/plasmid primase-like protien